MEELKNDAPTINEQDIVKLNYENKMLKQKLQEAYRDLQILSDRRGIERLQFLFTVAKNDNNAFGAELVQKAIEEIEESLYPKEEEIKNE